MWVGVPLLFAMLAAQEPERDGNLDMWRVVVQGKEVVLAADLVEDADVSVVKDSGRRVGWGLASDLSDEHSSGQQQGWL